MADEDYKKASEVALKLLARREHSRKELALKLMQRRVDESVIDRVLDDFEDRQWLDDERFAEVYVRQRLNLGYGPVRIRAELQQRGIEHEPSALREIGNDVWQDMATQARIKRFGNGTASDRKERGRQGRYLAQRGFAMDHIEAALGATIDDL